MAERIVLMIALCAIGSASAGCMTAFAAFQPENIGGRTIVITTFDSDDEAHERVVTPIDDDGRLVVAANHWPRAWYRRALANPDVRVRDGEETRDYRAVPASEEERERLLDESGFPAIAYLFTGFARREFLLLEPR